MLRLTVARINAVIRTLIIVNIFLYSDMSVVAVDEIHTLTWLVPDAMPLWVRITKVVGIMPDEVLDQSERLDLVSRPHIEGDAPGC